MTTNNKEINIGRIKITFRVVAVLLGLLQAWAARNNFDNNGVPYLDIGDAYFRGDWNSAINSYWSPLYSWLLGFTIFILKPSAYWETSCLYLVNFLIYLFALACFEFFLNKLIRYHQIISAKSSTNGDYIALPDWGLIIIGYSLFLFSSLKMITLRFQSPDMCVAAFVYLISGIILYIYTGVNKWFIYFLLGLALGFGYLAKAAMFPLTFVFLGITLFSIQPFQRSISKILIVLIAFLLVSAPFIIAISKSKEHLTFGEVWKLQYAACVNGLPDENWDEVQSLKNGIPLHPVRKIFSKPTINEFGTPFTEVTYPLEHDPYYWFEGVNFHFDLKQQIKTFLINARLYYLIFLNYQAELILACLILFCMGQRGWFLFKDISKYLIIIIPAIAAMFMYSLLVVQERYLGAFFLLLWMGLFSAARLHNSQESKRFISCIMLAVLTVLMVRISATATRSIHKITYDLMNGEEAHLGWQIASGLKQLGIQPKDKVALIADPYGNYWARLAKVKVVADIAEGDEHEFWAVNPNVKSKVINAFAKTGAKVIVTNGIPTYASTTGWQMIRNTDRYVYFLQK